MTKSITLNYTIAVLAALAIVLAYAGVADAAINSSNITVSIENFGKIDNTTSAKSSTGGNYADGRYDDDGDEGGDVEAEDGGDYNNGGATAGNGGDGGNASDGGLVDTGDATAQAGTENSLNGTDVDIDLMSAMLAGEDMNSTYIGVEIENGDDDNCRCQPKIDNDTRAKARTGDNEAEGSEGGDGDDGGDVESDDGDYNNGGASAGDGGNGGTGGIGGTVKTGNASSTAGTVNLLNTSIIRVRL